MESLSAAMAWVCLPFGKLQAISRNKTFIFCRKDERKVNHQQRIQPPLEKTDLIKSHACSGHLYEELGVGSSSSVTSRSLETDEAINIDRFASPTKKFQVGLPEIWHFFVDWMKASGYLWKVQEAKAHWLDVWYCTSIFSKGKSYEFDYILHFKMHAMWCYVHLFETHLLSCWSSEKKHPNVPSCALNLRILLAKKQNGKNLQDLNSRTTCWLPLKQNVSYNVFTCIYFLYIYYI